MPGQNNTYFPRRNTYFHSAAPSRHTLEDDMPFLAALGGFSPRMMAACCLPQARLLLGGVEDQSKPQAVGKVEQQRTKALCDDEQTVGEQ